mmetsp:Transcript_5735/g.14329  ORF Transcript_5735/g.14329 Transcript_5735/m.14329 type:complete len:300 (-) Transcript_5735:127-1026(-)
MSVRSHPTATRQEPRAHQALYSPRFLAVDPLAEDNDLLQHYLAQDLNNEACALIDGDENLPQAIQILEKALQLSDRDPTKGGRTEAQQRRQQQPSSSHEDATTLDAVLGEAMNRSERCRREEPPTFDDREVERYVHRELLFVNEACIRERRYMGTTLTAVILFNLAIAHHLLAMSVPVIYDNDNDDFGSAMRRMELLDRALKLYELCVMVHNHRECRCSDGASLRLKMLVTNNLGEIHATTGSLTRTGMCHEYLLRGLMFMVDGGREWLNPEEIDGMYRNMQSTPSRSELQRNVHAATA